MSTEVCGSAVVARGVDLRKMLDLRAHLIGTVAYDAREGTVVVPARDRNHALALRAEVAKVLASG